MSEAGPDAVVQETPALLDARFAVAEATRRTAELHQTGGGGFRFRTPLHVSITSLKAAELYLLLSLTR